MNVTTLAISILATWRLSHLLMAESGPGDILGRLRDRIGVAYDEASAPYGKNIIASAFVCLWCLSVWVGWGVALVVMPGQWFLGGLALSAGAIVVNKVVKA